jgi:hypothetical protein
MMEALVPDFEPTQVEPTDVVVGVAWLDEADPLVRARVEEAAAKFPNRRELELGVPDRELWGPAFRARRSNRTAGLYPSGPRTTATMYGSRSKAQRS